MSGSPPRSAPYPARLPSVRQQWRRLRVQVRTAIVAVPVAVVGVICLINLVAGLTAAVLVAGVAAATLTFAKNRTDRHNAAIDRGEIAIPVDQHPTQPSDPKGQAEPVHNPMFRYDEQLTAKVFEYCRWRLSLDPVPLDFAGEKQVLDAALDGLISPQGTDPNRVLEVFSEVLAPAVISCDSPRFLAFIPAAPTKASLLFDMITSCSSLQGSSWLESAGAVEAENQALRVLADLAGLPAGAGGVFVSGGSAGNLSALMVARDTGRRRLGASAPARLRVAVSDQSHSSVAKALAVLAMDPFLVQTADHRLTGTALASALESDPEPESVVAVAATAGTTNAGIVDDLAGLAGAAGDRGMWLHVDGAYGGAGLFAPSVRNLYEGIDRANSIVIDPHKWLYAPFDCAALLYREPHLARAVHTQDASYLDVIHTNVDQDWNPSDYAYHLTRRARGLALWFSLAVHGTDAYRLAVEAALSVARQAADLIASTSYLDLVRRPDLSVVLFRRQGWTELDYYQWSEKLLADQIGFVTPSKWEGETVARFAFLHPDTTIDIVREILDTMK